MSTNEDGYYRQQNLSELSANECVAVARSLGESWTPNAETNA